MNIQYHRERIWFWPLIIAVLSLFGLIVGLIFDGLGDGVAWLCLAVFGCACCGGVICLAQATDLRSTDPSDHSIFNDDAPCIIIDHTIS